MVNQFDKIREKRGPVFGIGVCGQYRSAASLFPARLAGPMFRI